MTPKQINDLNVFLNKAGGENTSEINRLHGEVVGLADQLPDSDLKTAIMAKTLQAESHNAVVGATLEEMQKWVKAQPVDAPPPTITDPATRAAFNAWVVTSTQEVTLDGVTIHPGFGPADAWFTLSNGMVSRTREVVTPPGTGGPEPAPTPTPGIYKTIAWGSWVTGGRYPTGPFNQAVAVYEVKVPLGVNRHYDQDGKATFAEWQGPPCQRVMSISTTPGDFTSPLFATGGTVPLISFNVMSGGDVSLTPGTTYYFNVRNIDAQGNPIVGDYPGSFAIQFPHDTGQLPPTA